MKVYSEGDFAVEYKEDDSPLTIADKRCNAVIMDYLKGTGIPVISEESKQLPYKERKNWDTCWIVDPLDGTKEFVKRNGEFTVNIALVSKGKPLLGVIYVPDSRQLFLADVARGYAGKLQLEDHHLDWEGVDWNGKRIKPAEPSRDKVRVVGSRSHMNEATEKFVADLGDNYQEVEIVSKGSSLKFCLVAEGKADLYPRYAPTMEWDTAAGQAICEAVGLEVISEETDAPLLYNKENLLNPWFLVRRK